MIQIFAKVVSILVIAGCIYLIFAPEGHLLIVKEKVSKAYKYIKNLLISPKK